MPPRVYERILRGLQAKARREPGGLLLEGVPHDRIVRTDPIVMGTQGARRLADLGFIGDERRIAGGLGPDNVRQIIRDFQPELVDVSSRLESVPGKKDPEALKKFFAELNI